MSVINFQKEIPHELMYALGLEHTFEEKNTYTFKEGETQNYMDYKPLSKNKEDFVKEKHYTYKLQWELARASKLIEKQLPLFSLLLFFLLLSCKTYKSVSCEYDYFPTKDEMVLDSNLLRKSVDLDKEKVINKHIKMRVNKTIKGYTKYIDIDTLGIELNRFVVYTPSKKIDYTFFSLGPYIGKEYHFDENGNVTKVIDNDEGFAICWQQALFIAKKYAGKDAFEWMIGKDFYKKRNAWEIYYRKNKTPYFLVIDAQTGEIVRKGLRGGYVNDYIK